MQPNFTFTLLYVIGILCHGADEMYIIVLWAVSAFLHVAIRHAV